VSSRQHIGEIGGEIGRAIAEATQLFIGAPMKLATLKVNASDKVRVLKSAVPPALWKAAYRALVIKDIPHADAYDPHYSPWLEPEFAARAQSVKGNTGLRPQSLYTLVHFLKEAMHLGGDVVECGVWRGGSARLLREEVLREGAAKKLYLFDSFEGMAAVDSEQDRHNVGDFRDTSLEHVQSFVAGAKGDDPRGVAVFRKGWIPETFDGLDSMKVCFAHIDLDLYQSILDSLAFVYPRLASRGVIVFDDYGFASCPGARRAVDEFFDDKPEKPFVLDTAQAVVIKR
jgi:O-methyltransferase